MCINQIPAHSHHQTLTRLVTSSNLKTYTRMENLGLRKDANNTCSSNRKIMKPLMERKRRARINACLTELKTLLQDNLEKEGCNHNKIEKADILETTVKHLRRLHQQHSQAYTPLNANKYKAGYVECVGEVSRYLSMEDGLDAELRVRMLNYLAARMNQASSSQFGPSENFYHQQQQQQQQMFQIPDMNTNNGHKLPRSPCQAQSPTGHPSSPSQGAQTNVSPIGSCLTVPGIGVLRIAKENNNNTQVMIDVTTQRVVPSSTFLPLVVSIPNDNHKYSGSYATSNSSTTSLQNVRLLTVAQPLQVARPLVMHNEKSRVQRMWRPW